MFLIRKIFDTVARRNHLAIEQVVDILRAQFPHAQKRDLLKVPLQLNDPLTYRYRSILLVAEDGSGKVKGFAMLLHMPDINILYLELISAAPSGTGGGIGGALYERAREEASSLGTIGVFFECGVDDASVIKDAALLKQNSARLKFYERYGARPIINNLYAEPAKPGDSNLYYLVIDDLGQGEPIRRQKMRRIVRAILERKYGDTMSKNDINEVVQSFKDDPVQTRTLRYVNKSPKRLVIRNEKKITLIVNDGHDIHHVKDRGYVEAPVRISVIAHEIEKTGLFSRVTPTRMPEKHIKAVHDKNYVDYLHRLCSKMPAGKSVYPAVFPIRNIARPPKALEAQVGYYCIDTFTPLNHNAYRAARGAVDCALTGARELLDSNGLAYALVRPPGHHAERRAFGGFCYFNSAAVAANYLSDYGRIAMLDIDFHHGNGNQDIFYRRSDVLTLSIHGDPHFAYPHFAGFDDEQGEADGLGFNVNYPLPEKISAERYQRTLNDALKKIKQFKPDFLVLCLGLDTAKDDPTGTWAHTTKDFNTIGRMIGELTLPTLIVQEGGYRTRTLGQNARHFFTGLWQSHSGPH